MGFILLAFGWLQSELQAVLSENDQLQIAHPAVKAGQLLLSASFEPSKPPKKDEKA